MVGGGAVAMGGFAVVVWVGAHRRVVYGAVLVLAGLSPLVGGLSRGVPIPLLRAQEALVLLVFLAVVGELIVERRAPRWTAVDIGYGVLVATGTIVPVLVAMLRGHRTSVDGLMTLAGPLKFYLVYRIAIDGIRSREELRRVLQVLALSSVVVAAVGVLEYYDVSGVRRILEQHFTEIPMTGPTAPWGQRNPETRRIMSTIGAWNVLGSFFAFTAVVVGAFALAKERLLPGTIQAVVVAACVVGLLLTGSLASTIGLVLGVTILTMLRRRIVPVLVGGAIAVAISVPFVHFLTDRLYTQYPPGYDGIVPQSVQFRLDLWAQQLLPALHGHWLFGIGGDLPASVAWMTEESYYMFTLFKGGLLYLAGAFVLFGMLLWSLWRRMRELDGAQRACAEAGLALCGALIVMDLNNAYSTYAIPAQTFWIVTGLALTRLDVRGKNAHSSRSGRSSSTHPVRELASQSATQ